MDEDNEWDGSKSLRIIEFAVELLGAWGDGKVRLASREYTAQRDTEEVLDVVRRVAQSVGDAREPGASEAIVHGSNKRTSGTISREPMRK